MADTAAQVRDVARLLREWGYTVVEVDGWEDRGRGSMTTLGRCEHHTAGGSGNAPSLRVVTFGRKGLRNSLSRWFVARDGTIYLVARRKSWHAGSGSKGTNGTLSGTEAEHSGSPDESWSQASLDAQAAISAAECAVFGVDPDVVWDHREHAPRRKTDRVHVDSPRWRDRVRRLLTTPDPDPEDDMLYLWQGEAPDGHDGYWLVQFSLTDDGFKGRYTAIQPDELDTWQERADNDPQVRKSDKRAAPSWFADLKRV